MFSYLLKVMEDNLNTKKNINVKEDKVLINRRNEGLVEVYFMRTWRYNLDFKGLSSNLLQETWRWSLKVTFVSVSEEPGDMFRSSVYLC